MGKFEVLGLLIQRRMMGDNRFYRYAEIHALMVQADAENSYTSVWRSVNVLFSDGLLEVKKEGGILERTLKFRAKVSKEVHSSGMKKKYNANGEQVKKSRPVALEGDDLKSIGFAVARRS